MYVNISIHDYLRALMGFHQYNTNFTLDPRIAMTEYKNVSRGLGNQVTVEFNLLYRFHCAIPLKDEKFTEDFMREMQVDYLENQDIAGHKAPWDHAKRQRLADELSDNKSPKHWDPKSLSLPEFLCFMQGSKIPEKEPSERTFGLRYQEDLNFQRNFFTGLFDDKKMISQILKDMDTPICMACFLDALRSLLISCSS